MSLDTDAARTPYCWCGHVREDHVDGICLPCLNDPHGVRTPEHPYAEVVR